MTEFLDEYLPDTIRAYPWTSSPRWSTTITQVGSGAEHRNKNWQHPLMMLKAPEGVRCHAELEDLYEQWLVCAGPFMTFPARDPLDFASRRLVKANLVPTIARTDQIFGIGDGATRQFSLSKSYTRGGATYSRRIYLPVLETIELGINALPLTTPNPWLPGGPYVADVVRYGGDVIFDHAPEAGQVLTWGGLFDLAVRFEADDSFDRIVSAFQTDGYADLTLVEVRPCVSADGSEGSGG